MTFIAPEKTTTDLHTLHVKKGSKQSWQVLMTLRFDGNEKSGLAQMGSFSCARSSYGT